MREYLKAYAKFHGRKFDGLCDEILAKFLALKPFTRGIVFHTPMSSRSEAGAAQDWVQVNFFITDALNGQAQDVADDYRVSKATVLYTALYWFVKYMRPPVPEPEVPSNVTSSAGDAP
jgi:hypothetical protein